MAEATALPVATGTDPLGTQYSEAEITVSELVSQAHREHESIRLGGCEDEVPDPLDELEAALRWGLERVKELRTHRHQWDEQDYCIICGADGRS